MKYWHIPILVLLLVACNMHTASDANLDDKDKSEKYYTVTRVIDGDTFWIEDTSGNREKIRLIGIDAPESRKTKHKEVQYYGKEAKVFLKKYLLGKKVALEFDVQERDKYGRILAYVFMEDGTFLNDYLVKSGYARSVTYQPNVKYQGQFVESERYARQNNVGMWRN